MASKEVQLGKKIKKMADQLLAVLGSRGTKRKPARKRRKSRKGR